MLERRSDQEDFGHLKTSWVSTYANCSVPYINFVQGKEVDISLPDQEIL